MQDSEKFLEELRALVRVMAEAEFKRAAAQLSTPLPLLLTKEAAAQQLSVGMTKLAQLIKRGEIATRLLGKVTMIPLSEVLRLSQPDTSPTPRTSRARRAPIDSRAEAKKAREALRKHP